MIDIAMKVTAVLVLIAIAAFLAGMNAQGGEE